MSMAGEALRKPRLGCLGEVMLELVLDDADQAALGVAGDTYNTAVYAAHDGRLDIDYITGLGSDPFSARIRAHMKRFGLGSRRVFTHPTRGPGLYAITTDAAGERSFTYWRSEAAARSLGDPDMPPLESLLGGLTHLFYSGISLAILPQANRDRLFEAVDAFRRAGGIVAFDSNYRPHLWQDADLARAQTQRAWQNCDIALPSVDDEMLLFGDKDAAAVLARMAGYGLRHGALKCGADGPIALDGQPMQALLAGASGHPAPPAPNVVDTTAAGDSFNALFLAEFLHGQDPQSAMAAGHARALEVIGQRGAIVFEPEDIA